jgi:hypothetical protein
LEGYIFSSDPLSLFFSLSLFISLFSAMRWATLLYQEVLPHHAAQAHKEPSQATMDWNLQN